MTELDRLIALALGELDPPEEAAVEEHLLACADCAATAEQLLTLGAGARDLIRQGAVGFADAGPLVQELESAGLVSRTYRIAPGHSVACSVGAADIYSATTLEADLTGVTRLDVVRTTPAGTLRVDDIPFDAARGCVTLLTPSALLRTFPSMRVTIQLIAVDPGGERLLGEYGLDHTAFAG